MICEQCGEAEASEIVTLTMGELYQTVNLCNKCARKFAEMEKIDAVVRQYGHEIPNPLKAAVARIKARDIRFAAAAYEFLYDAWISGYAAELLLASAGGLRPTEFLDAFRKLALKRFGKQARLILRGWGVNSCADVGEMCSNIIKDGTVPLFRGFSKLDFQDGYDFDDTFPEI